MSIAPSITDHCNDVWDDIVPVLHDYIAIPNVSPDFDPDWRANGFMAEAVDLIAGWCRSRSIPGMTLEVHELDGRTPMIVIEIPRVGGGSADDTVLAALTAVIPAAAALGLAVLLHAAVGRTTLLVVAVGVMLLGFAAGSPGVPEALAAHSRAEEVRLPGFSATRAPEQARG